MSDTPDLASLGHDYEEKLNVSPKSVASSWILMTGLSLSIVLAFNVLRPRNSQIYAPRYEYTAEEKMRIQPPGKGFFSWIPVLWRVREDELVEKLGLDAAVFLRFLRLIRTLFLLVSIVSLGGLMPLNIIYNMRNVDAQDRSGLTILTVSAVRNDYLWGCVAASYLFTFFTFVLIWWHYREVIGRRTEWFVSDGFLSALHHRCLLVVHVPDEMQSDASLAAAIDALEPPYKPTMVSIGHEIGNLPDKIEDQQKAVMTLEKALVKYLKGDKLGSKRPTVRMGPWWKFWGPKRDAIDFYTEEIRLLEASVEEERQAFSKNRPENYGFLMFQNAAKAQAVHRVIGGEHTTGIKILAAPDPKDIIWRNIALDRHELAAMRVVFAVLIAIVIFWYTIPLALISVLANLAMMAQYVKFLDDWQKANKISFSAVSGILSPVLAGIFAVLLPIALRALGKYQGAYNGSVLERIILKRLFFLYVLSQLFIFSILSVVLNLIVNLVTTIQNQDKDSATVFVKSIADLPRAISVAYLSQSSFWLTWMPMRGFLAFFELANLIKLILISSTYLIGQRTPRSMRKRSQPPLFKFAQIYPNLLLICAVGLVYAPLAPLVAAAATVAIFISSATFKYQLMFVYDTPVQTGGEPWVLAIDRLLFCVALMQTFVILTVSLQSTGEAAKRAWLPSVISAIPVLLTILYYLVIVKRFKRLFREYPTFHDDPRTEEVESQGPDKVLAPVHNILRPLEGILGKLDGGEGADGSDNHANLVTNLEARLRGLPSSEDADARFSHPALDAKLFSVMVFARHEKLLEQVYEGRVEHTSVEVSELGNRRRRVDRIRGVDIVPMEEHDLEFDANMGDQRDSRGD
ncbi:hypothetical protein BDY24DRAFT_443999 [Mrakia frigida]|uniref:uncharacterized protein n=1 Tax=Mrakia frigida TaxID=29902 RepID=UPI003FCC0C7F